MPVETRSSESSVTKHLKAGLNSIAAQRRTLLFEEEQELERVKNEYELKRKSLEAEAKRKQVELAAQRRREEELELARQRELESGKAKAKGSDATAAAAGLVKMVGKSVCTRCKDLKMDCYRAPRRNRQANDDEPGVLKDFVRCTTCIDAKQRCRIVVVSSTTSASARVASGQSKSKLSSTTTASLTIAPSRSALGAVAGTKRKCIVSETPSDEEEDEEDDEEEDSDSPPVRSAAKRHKTDGVTVNPRSKSTGRFLPTIKKPTSSKFVSHSKSKLHFARSPSSSSQSEAPSDASTSTGNRASAGTFPSKKAIKSILDTMNRNHEAQTKFFTQLLEASAYATPQSTPLVVQGTSSASRVAGSELHGSGDGSHQSQRASKTREKTPKNKREIMVKLEGNEIKQHNKVDQLASNEPEVIEIEDDDDN
ncbi:hypothetical protein H1R20_g12350, partial [Candolleomyces eurysporus]